MAGIKNALINDPGASWLSFKPRKLVIPDILDAPGVVLEDFDRLSVAFGLSLIQVGEFAKGKITEVGGGKITVRGCPGC
jgi:hypothetical protein